MAARSVRPSLFTTDYQLQSKQSCISGTECQQRATKEVTVNSVLDNVTSSKWWQNVALNKCKAIMHDAYYKLLYVNAKTLWHGWQQETPRLTNYRTSRPRPGQARLDRQTDRWHRIIHWQRRLCKLLASWPGYSPNSPGTEQMQGAETKRCVQTQFKVNFEPTDRQCEWRVCQCLRSLDSPS